MLALMRKHAQSWLIKVALFAIVIVFIFWGGYTYRERRLSRIAIVNGTAISMQEYDEAYNAMVQRLRQQFGAQFSADLLEALNVKQQALNDLINRRLLLDEAARMGLEVSTAELQESIRSLPAFQVNGRFDQQRYFEALRFNGMTPEQFEAVHLQEMLAAKVRQVISQGGKVREQDLREYYHHTRDQVDLSYVEVDPKDFRAAIEVDEEAVKDYFEAERESYRLPERRRVRYVHFFPGDYMDEVEVYPEEVQAYYDEHQDEYREPRQVRARHILFRLPEDAAAAKVKEIEARAREVLAEARAGKDFAALAKKYSEDSATAAKGGDLGFFTRDAMVAPFAEAAFSLDKGAISDLVRTPFGLHIIKIEDIQPEKITPLEKVRPQIYEQLKKERAEDACVDDAQSFADEALALASLDKAAVPRGLKVEESGLFAEEEEIPGLGFKPEVNKVLFSLQQGEISQPLKLSSGYLVAEVAEIQPSRLPELSEVKEKVTADWLAAESKKAARRRAEELLEAARRQGSLEKAAKDAGLAIKASGFFSLSNPAPAFDNNRDLLVDTLALTPENPLGPKPYEVGERLLVVALRARKPASEENFAKERDLLLARFNQLYGELAFQRWLAGLRQRAEIEILHEL